MVVAALGVGLVWGRGMTAQSRAARTPTAPPSQSRVAPAPQVGVVHPKRATVPVTIPLTANISSLRSAVIYTKTAGYLQEVRLRPGDRVTAGQVVATVDHAQLDAQVAQAQATLKAAQSGVQTAQVAVATARAQALNAQAALRNAQIAVADATIAAPFDGIVVSRSLDPGAYVTPGTSTPILQIADLDQIDVLVNVTEVQMTLLRVGAPVQIHVDAYPDRIFQGQVSRIAGGIDPMTRTVQAEIDIPNPGHLLRPGMYATVSLAAGEDANVLVIPLAALVSVGDQHAVWVVTDNVAHQRPVAVGRAVGDQVEVTAGLSDGDLVVAQGVDLVRDGQRVQGVPVGL